MMLKIHAEDKTGKKFFEKEVSAAAAKSEIQKMKGDVMSCPDIDRATAQILMNDVPLGFVINSKDVRETMLSRA